jgi:putative nucleotidyltransferase with HDIG domain
VLRKLLGKKDRGQPKVLSPLSPAIAEAVALAIGAKGIPPMPSSAQRAFQLSTDPTAEVRDFVDVIESDEALSARVLKIANSVYFDRGKPSKTIEESVVVIGINELRDLLNATSLSEIFPCRNRARQELWSHDVATALTARMLAERLCPAKKDLVFLGGLMHDIGKLLLLQRVTPEYIKILDEVEKQGLSFCAAEEDLFVFNHTEVGQLIGEKWNFSPELIYMIRNHHNPPQANTQRQSYEDDPSSLAGLVYAANRIAHALGLGLNKKFAKLKNQALEELPELLGSLGIEENQRDFLNNVSKEYDLEHDIYELSS